MLLYTCALVLESAEFYIMFTMLKIKVRFIKRENMKEVYHINV